MPNKVPSRQPQNHFRLEDDFPAFFNRCFLGDSRNMISIPDGTVSLIVTSPPYFSIKDYSLDGTQEQAHSTRKKGQIGDLVNFEEFLEALLQVWKECCRVLQPNGKLIINVPLLPMLKKDLNTHENRHIFDLNAEIQQSILSSIPDLFLLDTYIWNRTNPSKKLMFGSYPYPSNFYAQNTIEFVAVYVKRGPARKVKAEVKELSRLSQKEWIEYTKQVWDIPIPSKADKGYGAHSALMPEEIVRRCVKLYSFVGDVVLDPFAGSGTTLKVAAELGRNFVGYELVDEYAPLINSKIGSEVCVKERNKKRVPSEPSPVPNRLLNKVVNADVFDFLQKLPDACIPLTCVDPPYNLGKGDWDTWESDMAFQAFTRGWFAEVARVTSADGAIYVFNTPRNAALLLRYAERLGFELRNWITWDKRDGFAPARNRFVPAQETILFLTRSNSKNSFNPERVRVPYDSTSRIKAASTRGILKDGKRWFPNPDGKLCTDVWHFPSERHQTKVDGRIQAPIHPTQKPIALVERIILASSEPGDVVLDCFMGSGTTAVAAMKHRRNFIGCESNADFHQFATLRVRQFSE